MRTVVVGLTQGAIALVDASDIPIVRPYKWHVTSRGYAARTDIATHKNVFMHREIVAAPRGREVDHINGDPTDNRRSNLRICTHAENSRNRKPTTGRDLKGVIRYRRLRRFGAEIAGEYLGLFDTEIDAALAYDRRAIERFGEFARLNFPEHDHTQPFQLDLVEATRT